MLSGIVRLSSRGALTDKKALLTATAFSRCVANLPLTRDAHPLPESTILNNNNNSNISSSVQRYATQPAKSSKNPRSTKSSATPARDAVKKDSGGHALENVSFSLNDVFSEIPTPETSFPDQATGAAEEVEEAEELGGIRLGSSVAVDIKQGRWKNGVPRLEVLVLEAVHGKIFPLCSFNRKLNLSFLLLANAVEDLLALHNRYMNYVRHAHLLQHLTKLLRNELATNPASPLLSSLPTDERYRHCLEAVVRRVSKLTPAVVAALLRNLITQSRLVPKLLENQDFVRVLGRFG